MAAWVKPIDIAVRFIAALAITLYLEMKRYLPPGMLLAANCLLVLLLPASAFLSWRVPVGVLAAEALLGGIYFWIRYRRDARAACMRLTRRCEQNPQSPHYRYDQKGGDTPACCASHLLHVLYTTCGLLEEADISYFICDGTLLGAVRHGGLIPWDTDCDIAVLQEHVPRLRKLVWSFIVRGLWVYEHPGCFTIQYGVNGINSLHTDIYLVSRGNTGRLQYDDRTGIDPADVYPRRLYRFHERFLWGPNRAGKILRDLYGEDCLSTAEKKHRRDAPAAGKPTGPKAIIEAPHPPATLNLPLW
jgi:hypothetical protein